MTGFTPWPSTFQRRYTVDNRKNTARLSQLSRPRRVRVIKPKKLGNRGQGLMEYLILVCLIAIASITVVSTVGKNLREQYANISKALQNKGKVKVSDVESSAYHARGMDDFMDGAKDAP